MKAAVISLVICLFFAMPQSAANSVFKKGTGLLFAEEIAALIPSEQEAYVLTLQSALMDAEEAQEAAESESKPKPKKSSLIDWIFGSDAIAGDEDFCFMAGYLFRNPPCKPEPRFQGRCKPGEMECNPWLFGLGKTRPLCAVINYRNETRVCGGKSQSPAEVLSFINSTPRNQRLFNDFVGKIDRHCATGKNPRLCSYVSARLSGLNVATGGTIARAYGSQGDASRASARLDIYRPRANKLKGCDPVTLLHAVNFASSNASSLLSLQDVQGLICGRGTPPSAQHLASRESVLARAISRASRGSRVELQSARRNLQACVKASKTKTLSTTLSNEELRTSPNANRAVQMCVNSYGRYRIFAQRTGQKLNWRTGQTIDYQLAGATDFPESYIGTMASFYQVDLCSLQVVSCNRGAVYQTAPNPSTYTPRSQ